MTLRERYLSRLRQLQRNGWEQEAIPMCEYIRPTDDASTSRIMHYVEHIERYRRQAIKSRIYIILRIAGIILLLVLVCT